MDGQDSLAEPTSDLPPTATSDGATETAGDAHNGGDARDGGDADGADASGGDGAAHAKKRRKPRRDPNEPLFGALFLDELQRVAGLRGQFAYGVPAKLWRANREVMIRILREEVPMPTYKNQIQCILHEDPYLLAHDVHYEMLRSATPPEDSFRWLWLFMMLR